MDKLYSTFHFWHLTISDHLPVFLNIKLNSQEVNINLKKFSNLIYTLCDECFPIANIFAYYNESQTTIIQANPLHNYTTRHCHQLLPPHRLTIYQHLYVYQRCRIWNKIPDYIKVSSSCHIFKSKLQQYLILNY